MVARWVRKMRALAVALLVPMAACGLSVTALCRRHAVGQRRLDRLHLRGINQTRAASPVEVDSLSYILPLSHGGSGPWHEPTRARA